MNISLNWLQERLDLSSRSLEDVCDLLTFAGIEVEGVQTTGVSSESIVVGEIKEAVPHPDADRLKVTQVDAGEGQLRQIVCGATNYQVGDRVPCCLPGAELPGGFKIGETKMRGVESKGMLAAGSEIGLTDKEDGLLILEGNPAPGTPVKSLFEADTLIEVEITPNRPDLLSHSGMARELAALLETDWAPVAVEAENPAAAESVKLESQTCPYYTRTDLCGVSVGESPAWLLRKLTSVGLKPVNNVVDLTNYVLFELGQPLHAFDASKVEGSLIVRQADEGEKFLALDGETYKLTSEDCVIADESGKVLALAGVMGGLESGVTKETTEVILESAYFTSSEVRKTSRRLSINSDSSYRFERGVDPGQVVPAAVLARQLILETAGGTVRADLSAVGTVPEAPPAVRLDGARLDQLMDGSIPQAQAEAILERLGLSKIDGDSWKIPSWRGDLLRSADLVEEVARVHGLENVPSRTGGTAVDESAADLTYDRLMVLKHHLVALGFYETQTIKLISEEQLADSLPQRPLMEGDVVRVSRPLSADHAVMRPALTAGLLKVAETNLRQGVKSLRFFETGRQFRNAGGGKAKDLEADSVALLLGGQVTAPSWDAGEGRSYDLFDLKAVLQAVVGNGVVQFTARAREGFLLAGDVLLEGKNIGAYAQVMPGRAREIDFQAPLFLAEIDQGKLLAARKSHFLVEPLPLYPGSARDIAMELPVKTSNAEIEKALSKHQDPLLVGVECLSLFVDASGEKIAVDKKSVAYRFLYRAEGKTLKQKEVDAAHQKLQAHLQKALPVSFR